ncbi:TRPM8 channel-associated factor 2 isoform X1 [Echinops telfairi]|uniref:TRPM8 channel-associated factor 2 isoform X1 n=2 Tax=Echinops telfairi TaxID=9371 RepID=A0AC55CZI0_ECHTE|nr:TRPM8 channel-associated factor 2 isoform X1 [Echinops telfairi]XP_045144902.1 TRPM8 channel-associated factor 2 isoform X1 [Echinops telfairi]
MATPAAAFQELMNGVTSWDVPQTPVPCELLLIGEAAFPVMVNGQGQVLIAASSYGRGRLVVVAHEGYLVASGLAPFLVNAVHWLCLSPGAPVGVHPSLAPLVSILQEAGVQAQAEAEPGEAGGVYCTNAYSSTMAETLLRFVKRGAGLLIGGQAWYWATQHSHDKVLSEFPGNLVTSVAGVYFTDTYGDKGRFKVSKKVPKIPLHSRCSEDFSGDQQALLEGLLELDIRTGGVPSQLLVHGALAFPVGLDPNLGCFLAAAHYGRGRVVLAAHEGLLCAPKMGPFLLNAMRWLSRDQSGKVGVNTDLKNLCPLLSAGGLACSLESRLSGEMSVYCCKAYGGQEPRELQEFVAEGGGLLIGGQSWWWASQHPGRSALASFPGNLILNTMGLSIMPQTLPQGCFPTPTPKTRGYHFRRALSAFQEASSMDKSWLARLDLDVKAFLQIPAGGTPAYASLHRLLRKMLCQASLPAVSKSNPVARDSREASLLCLATVLAHSGTDCSQLTQGLGNGTCQCPVEYPITVEINGTNPGSGESWLSTGLYLPEGHSVEVSLSEAATSAGLRVQVGCHTDDLSHATKLCRAPVVTQHCCVDQPQITIPCLWGGLLYVIVPRGSSLGPVPINFRGVVPAPRYRRGHTSKEEWRRCLQGSPAPWGELATDNIILTVPTTSLCSLEDPEPLLRLWDDMLAAVATLGAQPFPFCRPERIVADVQISAGWMHSGYPIMCHLESVQELTSETFIRTKGLWGPVHELGHNQQRPGWEFPPHTTEATCNLWSVYVHESVLGIPRAHAHPALKPSERKKRIEAHLRMGAPLSNWNVWTALETYLQLQEAFGWEPFIRLFADYQTFSALPTDNVSKMNLWVKKFSEQVQKNLVPFFRAWGWPVQKEVAESLAGLPEWQENPMGADLLSQE